MFCFGYFTRKICSVFFYLEFICVVFPNLSRCYMCLNYKLNDLHFNFCFPFDLSFYFENQTITSNLVTTNTHPHKHMHTQKFRCLSISFFSWPFLIDLWFFLVFNKNFKAWIIWTSFECNRRHIDDVIVFRWFLLLLLFFLYVNYNRCSFFYLIWINSLYIIISISSFLCLTNLNFDFSCHSFSSSFFLL